MRRCLSHVVHGTLVALVFLSITCHSETEDSGHEEESEDDDKLFSNIPGLVQFDFKIEIDAGGQECFFQDIKQDAQLYISFEVLRGADRNVDLIIEKPDHSILEKHTWTSTGSTDLKIVQPGEYSFCIDNSFSRFSRKLVYFFLAAYVSKEWEDHAENEEQLEVSLAAIQETLSNVTYSIAQIRRAIGLGRVMNSKDQYVATTNNAIVQNLSLVMVVVFIMTSGIQVYFVKNMFKTVNVTPTTQKPRA